MYNQILESRLRAIISGLTYPVEGVDYITEEIIKISSLYNDPEAALEIIVEQCEKYLTGPFSSKQFQAFLREIDPTRIENYVYLECLGMLPNQVKACLSPEEQALYWEDKRDLDRRLISAKKGSLELLKSDCPWDILTSKNWRNIKPSLGLYREIKTSVILTPMGGQPRYQRKTRH